MLGFCSSLIIWLHKTLIYILDCIFLEWSLNIEMMKNKLLRIVLLCFILAFVLINDKLEKDMFDYFHYIDEHFNNWEADLYDRLILDFYYFQYIDEHFNNWEADL